MRQIIFFFAVGLLGLAGSGPASAQVAPQSARSLDPNKAITQYALDHWGTEDGLPLNTVNKLIQTRDGYLWLGTQEGIARFDGLSFKIFDKSNSALRNNNIPTLYEGRDGTLWIGTRGGGLTLYKDEQFSTYALIERPRPLFVTELTLLPLPKEGLRSDPLCRY